MDLGSKISIITPSFNQGLFIEQTIASVLSQLNLDDEYIIMDGNSTDNSIEIIRKFENRLSFWESKTDKGQSHAINKGLEKCSGKIFNWIGSDDYLEPGGLDEVRKIFLDDTIRVVSGKVRIINSNQNDDQHLLDGILLDESVEKTFAGTSMTQPVTFWRLDDIKKFGLLNERLHYLMDLESG